MRLQCRRHGFDPWVGKIPWRRIWQSTHILAWRIPWTEEPGGPQSMGSQRVGHDWMTEDTHTHQSSWMLAEEPRLLGQDSLLFTAITTAEVSYFLHQILIFQVIQTVWRRPGDTFCMCTKLCKGRWTLSSGKPNLLNRQFHYFTLLNRNQACPFLGREHSFRLPRLFATLISLKR